MSANNEYDPNCTSGIHRALGLRGLPSDCSGSLPDFRRSPMPRQVPLLHVCELGSAPPAVHGSRKGQATTPLPHPSGGSPSEAGARLADDAVNDAVLSFAVEPGLGGQTAGTSSTGENSRCPSASEEASEWTSPRSTCRTPAAAACVVDGGSCRSASLLEGESGCPCAAGAGAKSGQAAKPKPAVAGSKDKGSAGSSSRLGVSGPGSGVSQSTIPNRPAHSPWPARSRPVAAAPDGGGVGCMPKSSVRTLASSRTAADSAEIRASSRASAATCAAQAPTSTATNELASMGPSVTNSEAAESPDEGRNPGGGAEEAPGRPPRPNCGEALAPRGAVGGEGCRGCPSSSKTGGGGGEHGAE
mmetsp:Transcript_43136/g.109416  ORF Transcript_43136/g.109416 Transcript_43136/m.109416 type:complete len:358 (+) Transcript_43136:21-1094(+)